MQTPDFAVIRSQLEGIQTVDDVKDYLGMMLNFMELSYIDADKVKKANAKVKELTEQYRRDVEAVMCEAVDE